MGLSNTPRLHALIVALATSAFTASVATAQDAEAGEKVFKKCKACHAVGEGAANKVGPQLNELIGRVAGSVEGYSYSSAVQEAGAAGTVWNEASLNEFLLKPKDFIKGTKMSFAGLKKDDDRADVIAYLATFSAPDSSSDATQPDAPAEETAATAEAPSAEEEAEPEFTEAYLAEAENIEAGKQIWFDQCTHCHGYKAYPGKAPKLKPAKYKPEFVFKRVTKGFKKMPAWGDVYSREERMAIVAYVKSPNFAP